MSQVVTAEGQKLVIRRTFAAPVDRVYQAWTDPRLMSRWFLPNERWNESVVENDLKVGGAYKIAMHHSDGDVLNTIGHYLEVVPNERLSFTWDWLESPTGRHQSVVSIELRPVPGGTELTLTHDRLADAAERENVNSGWAGCLNTLDGFLTGTTSATA
jgi:uncharacterized protein YndB with AHSA1/START domain